MYSMVNVHELIYSTSVTSVSRMGVPIKIGPLFRMGVLIGKGALIDKNAYWKEGTKSSHYSL